MTNTRRLLLLIVALSAFLRFYNLGWGLPYGFHPDERNMAVSISQLSSHSLHPHFFAYGQFPLYLAYFSHQIFSLLTSHFSLQTLSFATAILWLRFWSAVASTLTVLLVYNIYKNYKNYNYGLLAALLTAFTPGLIQSAHFGTTESLLTFFFLMTVWLSIKLARCHSEQSPAQRDEAKNPVGILNTVGILPPAKGGGQDDILQITILGIILGLSLSTKLTAVYFFLPPLLSLIISAKSLKRLILRTFFLLTISFLVFFLTSPFNFLDFQSFRSALDYETGVARGTIEVFYTRQFLNTTPILFQFQKIFPYALGWPIFILGSLGFLYMLNDLRRERKNFAMFPLKEERATMRLWKETVLSRAIWKLAKLFALPQRRLENLQDSRFLIIFSFLIYFLPNAFLFAKWTRFMTPIFPFFAIFSAVFLYFLIAKKPVITFITVITVIPGLTFFTLYLRPDIRFAASSWIYQNIPEKSHLLFETANVVDIPILPPSPSSPSYPSYSLTSFNFYDLDISSKLQEDLIDELFKADYFLIPSRRIFANFRRFPGKYPLLNRYYFLLFSGKLGFEKMVEFKALDDEAGEETFTVFDHPVIRIYKKTGSLGEEEYRRLLGI